MTWRRKRGLISVVPAIPQQQEKVLFPPGSAHFHSEPSPWFGSGTIISWVDVYTGKASPTPPLSSETMMAEMQVNMYPICVWMRISHAIRLRGNNIMYVFQKVIKAPRRCCSISSFTEGMENVNVDISSLRAEPELLWWIHSGSAIHFQPVPQTADCYTQANLTSFCQIRTHQQSGSSGSTLSPAFNQ